MPGFKTAKIRKKILAGRGVQLEKHTGKPITYDDLPAVFPKSKSMKYIELKFGNTIENIIFKGTIYEVAKKVNMSPSCISRWRKLISEAKEKKFWRQFPDGGRQ
jgi:hypothetical protein